MSFENLQSNEQTGKTPEAAGHLEAVRNDVELSSAMQELYEEITAEDADESKLEGEAEKMSSKERLGVLGKAISRAGKLARRIALVAFAGFTPSLAGSADNPKHVEENLAIATQTGWQDVKAEKLSPKEERLKREKEAAEADRAAAKGRIAEAASMGNVLSEEDIAGYEQQFGLSRAEVDSIYKANKAIEQAESPTASVEKSKGQGENRKLELTREFWEKIKGGSPGAGYIPSEDEELLSAFEKGEFKNNDEFLKWDAKRKSDRYPEIAQKIVNDNHKKIDIGHSSYLFSVMEELGPKYGINGISAIATIVDYVKKGLIN
jgi:hypothetical protein